MPLTKVSFSMINGAPINVLDYGADPTGATSSVAAFQAAIAICQSQNKSLYLPAGRYLIDSPINSESAPLYAFTIFGDDETHNGVSTGVGRTVIDMAGNTQYAFAVGYSFRMRDLMCTGGTDFIHWTSSGLDGNTTYIENVSCHSITGTFFKVYDAGNGSQIIMNDCQFVDYLNILNGNIDTFCVFDNLTEDVATDSLTLTGCWIETYAVATFKLASVRFQMDNTRLVPYQANGYWIIDGQNSAEPSQIYLNNADFGGEFSGRRVLLSEISGTGVVANNCGVFCASLGAQERKPFNFNKAPSRIIFNECVGFTDVQAGVINFDSGMSAAEKAKLTKTIVQYNNSFSNENIDSYFVTPSNLAFSVVAKQPPYPINRVCTTSDLAASTGISWITSTSSSGITTTSLNDSIGDAGFQLEYEVTNATGSIDVLWSGSFNISTLPNGNYTYETYLTTTGDCKVSISAANSVAGTTFELAAGSYQLCLPFILQTDNVRNITINITATTGVKFAASRTRIWTGFHLSRSVDMYGSAAPSGGTNLWFVGDRVINSVPTVGQPIGWVCTVAGTPGTWVALANL